MFSMFSLSKVSKLYFHTQFKSHNIQILNNNSLISIFSQWTAGIYYFLFFILLIFFFSDIGGQLR
jgi:hypothetical protein